MNLNKYLLIAKMNAVLGFTVSVVNIAVIINYIGYVIRESSNPTPGAADLYFFTFPAMVVLLAASIYFFLVSISISRSIAKKDYGSLSKTGKSWNFAAGFVSLGIVLLPVLPIAPFVILAAELSIGYFVFVLCLLPILYAVYAFIFASQSKKLASVQPSL